MGKDEVVIGAALALVLVLKAMRACSVFIDAMLDGPAAQVQGKTTCLLDGAAMPRKVAAYLKSDGSCRAGVMVKLVMFEITSKQSVYRKYEM